MTLTEDQQKAQPLLEQYGIIVAPNEIDHDTYLELSWALKIGREMHPESPLELRCCGIGGEVSRSFAIYDLVQQDGNIDGIALGRVSSGHTIIWSGCNRRFVYPTALVSIHQTKNGAWLQGQLQRDYELGFERYKWGNRQLVEIYAKSSNQGADFWHDKVFSAGAELLNFDASQLIELEMAAPISERDP
jgi:ATP-dependent protease ClpP protease subunit